MLVEPEGRRIARLRLDQRGGLARGELLLELPGELRIAQLDREHEAGPVPDVLGGQPHPARQQIAEFAELAHRAGHARAQPVHMRAAGSGRDQIHVAFGDEPLRVRRPQQRPVDRILFARAAAADRLRRQPLGRPELFDQVGAEIAAVEPLLLVIVLLVGEADAQPRAQHRLGLEHALEVGHREAIGVEEPGVRPEAHRGPGIARSDGSDRFELGLGVPVAESDVVLAPAAAHPAFHVA